MEKIVVDARGLSCPQPVLLTMQALKKQAESWEILVDNHTALGNVSRFVSNAGKTLTVTEQNGEFTLLVK